jgi:hypothetical protein
MGFKKKIIEREREKRKWGVVVLRDATIVGGKQFFFPGLKVPRHCP